MTEEEVKTLESLYNEFLAKCKKICEELERLDGGYGHCDKFMPMGDDVYCHGHEYWSYGFEEHEKSFPTILLTYTEEELKDYVDAHLLNEHKKKRNVWRKRKKKRKKWLNISV